jgi:hypothetical protein
MTSGSTREIGHLLRLDLQRQRSRNPSRCQRSTVSGFTSNRALRQCGRRLASTTMKPRSLALKMGRLTALDATASCWRSKAFSIIRCFRERVTSARKPASTGKGRVACPIAVRARLNIRPAADLTCRMMTASTKPVCSKPDRSSRLERNGNLNDHEAEDSWSR